MLSGEAVWTTFRQGFNAGFQGALPACSGTVMKLVGTPGLSWNSIRGAAIAKAADISWKSIKAAIEEVGGKKLESLAKVGAAHGQPAGRLFLIAVSPSGD